MLLALPALWRRWQHQEQWQEHLLGCSAHSRNKKLIKQSNNQPITTARTTATSKQQWHQQHVAEQPEKMAQQHIGAATSKSGNTTAVAAEHWQECSGSNSKLKHQ